MLGSSGASSPHSWRHKDIGRVDQGHTGWWWQSQVSQGNHHAASAKTVKSGSLRLTPGSVFRMWTSPCQLEALELKAEPWRRSGAPTALPRDKEAVVSLATIRTKKILFLLTSFRWPVQHARTFSALLAAFPLRVAADPLGGVPLLSPQASGLLMKDVSGLSLPLLYTFLWETMVSWTWTLLQAKQVPQRVPSPRQEMPRCGPRVHGHIAWPFRAMSLQRAWDESKALDRGSISHCCLRKMLSCREKKTGERRERGDCHFHLIIVEVSSVPEICLGSNPLSLRFMGSPQAPENPLGKKTLQSMFLPFCPWQIKPKIDMMFFLLPKRFAS